MISKYANLYLHGYITIKHNFITSYFYFFRTFSEIRQFLLVFPRFNRICCDFFHLRWRKCPFLRISSIDRKDILCYTIDTTKIDHKEVKIMNWAATVWLVLMAGFLILEASCPCHLVSIWFAAGALVAGIVALLNGAIWLQVVLFLVVSCGLLIATFPLVKKFLRPRIVKTNVDSIVGSQGYVTEDIDNVDAVGQVKLGGMPWTARSASGENIPKGTLVKVEHIEGVKAFVSPVEMKAESEKLKVEIE